MMTHMGEWSDSRLSWLALRMIPHLGNITYKRLLDRFGDPAAIFEAPLNSLLKVEGLNPGAAKSIKRKAWKGDPEKELLAVEKAGIRLVPISDSAYPRDLREIHDPPPLLYLKGNVIPLGLPMVAVVGSRNPSHYGLKITEEICQGLAMKDIAVVSGMARGIDSAAHWGSLRGGGFTIAVLGSGMDVIYPSSNITLFKRIAEHGAILTEFPLGTPPEAKNFPIRNRVISGLSKGVVVVEASKQSGSLITASLALEQGRDVFAVPGSVESFKSTGTHLLIKQGAKLVENSDDIVQELGLNDYYPEDAGSTRERSLPPMAEDERKIYDMLGAYPLHIDHITRHSEMGSAKVASLLTGLELRGIVKQLPGKMFIAS